MFASSFFKRILMTSALIATFAVPFFKAGDANAFNKSGSATLLGGFNDNVDLLPDGSADKEESLFGRAFVFVWFDWATARGDKFYLTGVNDNLLYLTSGESSSILLKIAPGFRFKAMGGRLETDLSAHLASNMAFEDEEPMDDGRTRNQRTGKPHRDAGQSNAPVSNSSTFFSRELRAWSLYDLGMASVGPVFRLGVTDYTKVPQEDTLLYIAGRAVVDFTKTVQGTFELGIANNDSDIQTAGYSGPQASAGVNWNFGSGFAASGDYQYSFRDFEDPSTREDRIHSFRVGVEKELSNDSTFEFEFQRVSNDSTSSGAEYTANVISAGVTWTLF